MIMAALFVGVTLVCSFFRVRTGQGVLGCTCVCLYEVQGIIMKWHALDLT
jgi:hypothetical protein